MREIKFRAWDSYHKEFIFDAQATYDNQCRGKGSINHESFQEVLEDETCIVEQFTGLKDKNGKEIYEGDIVGCDYCCESHIISWCDNAACFEAWQNDGAPCLMLGESHEQLHYRVIGNIHENPELLEVEDEDN